MKTYIVESEHNWRSVELEAVVNAGTQDTLCDLSQAPSYKITFGLSGDFVLYSIVMTGFHMLLLTLLSFLLICICILLIYLFIHTLSSVTRDDYTQRQCGVRSWNVSSYDWSLLETNPRPINVASFW